MNAPNITNTLASTIPAFTLFCRHNGSQAFYESRGHDALLERAADMKGTRLTFVGDTIEELCHRITDAEPGTDIGRTFASGFADIDRLMA